MINKELVVCVYRGREFTQGIAPNRMPMIHFYEDNGDEYGLAYGDVEGERDAVILVLKADLDHRLDKAKAMNMIRTGECTFSPCRTWRYTLWRESDNGMWRCFPGRTSEPFLTVIGLNPSIADETQNDNTISSCVDFARRWGFRRLCMLNIFAFRATDPRVMKAVDDPVGPDNDRTLLEITRTCQDRGGMILAAWGVHGDYRNRDDAVVALLAAQDIRLHCLRKTRHGFPKHPLRQARDVTPIPYP